MQIAITQTNYAELLKGERIILFINKFMIKYIIA